MKDEERYKLHFGPYYPPKVRSGDRLFDEIHGTVIVGRYSDGEIPWPCRKRRGYPSIILCGDLVKAVRRESRLAICHWWGVGGDVVTKWRKALEVKGTYGTYRLASGWNKEPPRLAILARAIKIAMDPIRCARRARQRRRKGLPPKTGRRWLPHEDTLLGTMTDKELASSLGCSEQNIAMRRRALNVRSFHRISPHRNKVAISHGKMLARRLKLQLHQATVEQRAGVSSYGSMERGVTRTTWPETVRRLAKALECRPEDILLRGAPVHRAVPDDSLLGKSPDAILARKWRLHPKTVTQRRKELGVPAFIDQRSRLIDDSLLGTRYDHELAAMWGVTWWHVGHRRRTLGIAAFAPRPGLIPDESLLGTATDRELAQRWNLTTKAVCNRRAELGITAFFRRKLTVPDESLLGLCPDPELAAAWGLPSWRVSKRRVQMGIPPFRGNTGVKRDIQPEIAQRLAATLDGPRQIVPRPKPRRTIPHDSLLGTMSDMALARHWKLSVHDVRSRRVELGIPSLKSKHRPPTIPDKSLLGTRPDRELAALWALPASRVFQWRHQLGIPAFSHGKQ